MPRGLSFPFCVGGIVVAGKRSGDTWLSGMACLTYDSVRNAG